MKTNKMFGVLCILFVAMFLIASCTASGAVPSESQQIKQQRQHYEISQPVPAFEWSLERDVLIQLYLARNEALATYTVITSSFGDLIYQCASIGYPMAANTQLTNPEAAYDDANSCSCETGSVVLPQIQPNGLYNDNGWGTWVMCVLEDGTVYPYYTEQNAHTWPFVVTQAEDGSWVPAEGAVPSKTLDITR